jgi:NADPH:quinone reductase-like Zn-dependent oxidoreductase
VGANVKRFKVGEEVYLRPYDFHIGEFAEYIALNENDVVKKLGAE